MAYTIDESKKLIAADSGCYQYMGRIDFDDPKHPVMTWPATTVDTVFTGTSLGVVLNAQRFMDENNFGAVIDGVMHKFQIKDNMQDELYILAEGLEDREHTLRLVKTLASHNYVGFVGIVVDKDAKVRSPHHSYDYRLEVYGDSVSAGEVVEAIYYEGQCDPADHRNSYDNAYFSYPMMLARKLNAEVHNIAQGGIALLDGTGYFCSDMLTGMESCYDKIQFSPYAPTKPWDFSRYVPDVVIIALGQNDANPEPERIKTAGFRRLWKDEYKKLLNSLMDKYLDAKFVLTLTVLGHDRTWDDALDEIASEVASPRVTHYTFRRSGKATNGHPRATEQEEMAGELYAYLTQSVLR